MFEIDKDKTIHLTRGDIASMEVGVTDAEGKDYKFVTGDVVRFKVFEKKNHSNVVLQKDIMLEGETTILDIVLNSEDTTIGDIIDKPKEYWYEIELNPDTAPQTVVGYDEDGAKVLKLYPEGGDVND